MTEKRRPCRKCGRNRADRFFTGPRGHTCSTCRKRRTSLASRAVRLQETYGVSEQEYQAIVDFQGGVCAICKGKRSYNYDLDHDHALEKIVGTRASVRGALCKTCNRRLLKACHDDIEILIAAIQYLLDPPAHQVLNTALVPKIDLSVE